MIRGFVLSKTMSRAGTHSLRDFIDEVVDFAETLLRRRLRLVVLLACVWFAAVLYVGSKAVRGPVLRRRHRRPPQPGPDSEGSLCEVARPPPSGALRRLQHRLLSAVGWSGREPVKGRPAPARGPWRSGLYDVKGYCNLSSLAHFLAEVPWDRLAALCGAGQCYERMRHYGRFLEHLVPYVIAPPGPLAVTRRPVPLEAAGDCGHPDWARLFTGAQRPQRLQVLHFVPIGYNMRLLEAMLYELYDAVDYFVLYESSRTQIGVKKAAFFDIIRHRLPQFDDKIIYLFDDVRPKEAETVLKNSCRRQDWRLESRMRTWPVEQFRKIMGNYTTAAPSEVLVLGSDADEIATGEAVWRLSRCELRGAPALDEWTVYFGALETKYTADSLEALADGPCAADQQEPRELARAVWGSGPVARTLARVLREEVSPRAPPAQFGCNARPWKTKKVLHMPVGSAIHMSSMNEPTMRLFKDAGTVEGGVIGRSRLDFSKFALGRLLQAHAAGALTPAVLRAILPRHAKTQSVFSMPEEARRVWRRALPWVMRENPQYFCFELPCGVDRGCDEASPSP